MKKDLIFKNLLVMILVVSVVFTSCVKSRDGRVDFSQIAPIMMIPEGSLDGPKFSAAGLQFDGADLIDSVLFRVNYAAATVAPTDLVVTLGIDAPAMAKYNADEAAKAAAAGLPAPIPYQLFPDSIYKFTTTSVTVKAGESYSDAIYLYVYPYKVNPAINYMLPISIKTASGVNISANFGTVYYHFIGNCLAGTYNNVGTRYNYTGAVLAGWNGGPFPPGYSTAVCGTPKVLAAVNSTTTTTYYANLGAGTDRDYYFTYNCSTGGTSVDVTFTPSFLAGISNVVIPTRTYDPVLKKLHIISSYNNQPAGAGSDRIVEETMTKQ